MMKCGKQGLSSDEWLAYLAGAAPNEVAAHLAECDECRMQGERLAGVTARLQKTGATVSANANPATLARIWDGLRFRMRKFGSATKPLTGIEKIRSFLIPIVGVHSADDMLRVARSTPRLESDPHFEDSLGAMVQAVCGDQAARFVRKAARRRAA